MAIGIRGFAAMIAVAALMVIGVACGNGAEPTSLSDEVPTPAPPTVGGTTPTSLSDEAPTQAPPAPAAVSHGGSVKDYVSLVDSLRAAGATVVPAGTEPADQLFAPQADDLISGPTQVLTVNGEDINAYEFGSAEEADAGAEGVSASGSSIVVTYPDGTGTSINVTWVESPHFYKAGKLIVLYVGCDSDVIDVLQETMGPQFAGGAGVGVQGVSVVGHGRCPSSPTAEPAPGAMGMVAPDLRLTFEGVEYIEDLLLGVLSPTGVCVQYNPSNRPDAETPVTPCLNPIINMDDMEVVGTGTEHNPDGDASVEVYRPKAGESDFLGDASVYTFQPAPSDTWTRWTK